MEDKRTFAMQIDMRVLDVPLGKQDKGSKKEPERGLRKVEKGKKCLRMIFKTRFFYLNLG